MAGGVRYRFSEWAEHTAPIFTLPENTAKGQIGVVVKGNTEVDELGNVKSTVGAIRAKSVGKNFVRNGNGEEGLKYWNPVTLNSLIFSGEYFEKIAGVGTTIYSEYFKLPIGQFRLSSMGQSLVGSSFQVDLLDENGASIGTYYHGANLAVAGVTISLTESKNVRIRLITGSAVNRFIIKQIQLERNTVTTPYEPYAESNAYAVAKDDNKIVTLKSVPSAKDEVNVVTGVATKNVSDTPIVIDGNINCTVSSLDDNYYRLVSENWANDINILQSTNNSGLATSDDGNYTITASASFPNRGINIGSTSSNNTLYVRVEKSKIDAMIGVSIVDKFKAYLNQYPITLTYQLNDPIILDTVEVEYTENGQPSDHLKAWGPNTTIIVEVPEDSTIPTILESHVEVVI
jgi:hypothetical protein